MSSKDPGIAKPIALKKKASADWRGIRLAYPMTVHTPRGDNRAGEFAWLVYNVKSREQLVMEDAHFRTMFAPRGKTSKDSADWQREGSWVVDLEEKQPDDEAQE